LEVIQENQEFVEGVTLANVDDGARPNDQSQQGSNANSKSSRVNLKFFEEFGNVPWEQIPMYAQISEIRRRRGDEWSKSDLESVKREHEAGLPHSVRDREEKFDQLISQVKEGHDWVRAADEIGLERWEVEERRRVFSNYDREFKNAVQDGDFNQKYKDVPWDDIPYGDQNFAFLRGGGYDSRSQFDRIIDEHNARLDPSVLEREKQFSRFISKVEDGLGWSDAAAEAGLDMGDIQAKQRVSQDFQIKFERAILKNAPRENNMETVEWYKEVKEKFDEGLGSSADRPYWVHSFSIPWYVERIERNEAKRQELKEKGGIKNWIIRKALYE
jgi:hypothetical protein